MRSETEGKHGIWLSIPFFFKSNTKRYIRNLKSMEQACNTAYYSCSWQRIMSTTKNVSDTHILGSDASNPALFR